MPYLRTGVANYFGFMPAEGDARTRIYMVSSSEGTAINLGDVVCYTTDARTPASVRIVTGSGSTDAGLYVGVAASRVAANEGSTSADPRVLSTQTLLVYDDPNTIFVGCDTTSGVIGVGTDIGKAFAVVSTGAVGSTGPNGTLLRSVQALSGVTASSGSANGYRFKVIGLHPIESAFSTVAAGAATSSGEVRRWLCVPTLHVRRPDDAAHVTT